jgi:hypothetical protein
MAFLTAEQKKEQGLIHGGFDHAWMIRRELKNGKVACGVEPAYRKAIRSALLSSDGWASLLLGNVQAFEYENCASD